MVSMVCGTRKQTFALSQQTQIAEKLRVGSSNGAEQRYARVMQVDERGTSMLCSRGQKNNRSTLRSTTKSSER